MGDYKGFTHLSRSWYGEVCLKGSRYIDEVLFGVYFDDGGCHGEMSMKWYELGNKTYPRLEVFSDAWSILYKFDDVLKRLNKLDNLDPCPEEICQLLEDCGFKDDTKTER